MVYAQESKVYSHLADKYYIREVDMNLELDGIQEKPETKMKRFRKLQKQANRELSDLSRRRLILSNAIPEMRMILEKCLGPELADELTEGIYCGAKGYSSELIPGYPARLTMDWCYGKLEVAYIS